MNDQAMFGGGKSRNLELSFRTVPGVVSVATGYSGGDLDNPTQEEVDTDTTGHAHVIHIEFNPAVVTYEELLDLFWKSHDPTTINQQGDLIGSHYRSVIFYYDAQQREAVFASRLRLQATGRFRRSIVTQISEAGEFFSAQPASKL